MFCVVSAEAGNARASTAAKPYASVLMGHPPFCKTSQRTTHDSATSFVAMSLSSLMMSLSSFMNRRLSGMKVIRPISAPRFDLRPKPVHDALRFLIVRLDGVEGLHRRLVRIDRLVFQDRLVDQQPACGIAVRIGNEVGILRRDLRLEQIIDQRVCVG